MQLKPLTRGFAVTGFLALFLAACSGGGGGGGGQNPAAPVPSTLGGVAAVGSPIANGTVQVKCAGGAALNTSTDSAGSWNVTISGQTLPCAAELSGGTINGAANTTRYHAIATSLGTVNLTPLTELLVANLAGKSPSTWFAEASSTTLTGISASSVNAALINLQTALSGLSPLGTTHPVTTTFVASAGNKSDDMLTALKTAMSTAGIDYPTLVGQATTSSFETAAASLNFVLPNAYAQTVSGAVQGATPLAQVGESLGDVSATISTTGRLQVGGSLFGNSASGDSYDEDWYAITLTAGVPYVFELHGVQVPLTQPGSTVGVWLVGLMDSVGNILVRNGQDTGSTTDSRIDFTPSDSGTYYVNVRTKSATYRLSAASTGVVGVVPPKGSNISWIQPVGSTLVRNNTTQPMQILVNLTAGQAYSFQLTDNSYGAFVRPFHQTLVHLVDSHNVERVGFGSSITYTPTVSDTYHLESYPMQIGILVLVEASVGIASGNGLIGTWCTEVNNDQNCWVFDSNTNSETGKFYQQSINNYSGTLTNKMKWSVDMAAMTLTYQFTHSELTGSPYSYSQDVNQPAHTFPFTLTATTFTYQGIVFKKK